MAREEYKTLLIPGLQWEEGVPIYWNWETRGGLGKISSLQNMLNSPVCSNRCLLDSEEKAVSRWLGKQLRSEEMSAVETWVGLNVVGQKKSPGE